MTDDEKIKLRNKRFSEMVRSAQIRQQNERFTAYHTMLTRDQFVELATELAKHYKVCYTWKLADEKPVVPPTYHYLIIIEEHSEDESPLEYPPQFVEWED